MYVYEHQALSADQFPQGIRTSYSHARDLTGTRGGPRTYLTHVEELISRIPGRLLLSPFRRDWYMEASRERVFPNRVEMVGPGMA